MIIDLTSRTIEILAPAKLNLFLEVLGKRADGYHEIDTLMCPITLFDRVVFEPTGRSELEFELVLPQHRREGDPAWDIPEDDSNLAIRALRLLQSKLGTRQGGRLRLEKQIPAAAGLAGGSSDTAAAVCAALLAWFRWDRGLATSVCSELGSDIPFFLGDQERIGLAHATGRGENCVLLSSTPALRFVVTHPPAGCNTGEVYRRLIVPKDVRHSGEIIAACENGQVKKIGAELFNGLQFSASELTDWIDRQMLCFGNAGIGCIMSGSGSSCFALLDGESADVKGLERLTAAALDLGIERVYQVNAHYSSSIESQISRQKSEVSTSVQ